VEGDAAIDIGGGEAGRELDRLVVVGDGRFIVGPREAAQAFTTASPSPLPARQIARSSAFAGPAKAVAATMHAKRTQLRLFIAGLL